MWLKCMRIPFIGNLLLLNASSSVCFIRTHKIKFKKSSRSAATPVSVVRTQLITQVDYDCRLRLYEKLSVSNDGKH